MHTELKEHQKCIDACTACAHECSAMLFGHCLEAGGEHLNPEHVKLMSDCIDICNTAVKLMLRHSEYTPDICATCADLCDDCADSCEELSGEEMKRCAEICRKCADLCRSMSESYDVQSEVEGAGASA